MTGGRLRRVARYVEDEDAFCLTYGDGVSDVNITDLIAFHREQHVKATVTAVLPPGRFGALELSGDLVTSFIEKPKGDGGMINGGFFVLSPQVIDYITDDQTVWERDPIEHLSRDGNLAAFKHHGFWQPMDTQRDMIALETLWQSGQPPWKVWL
jgi:glucose-1-phosphate cytidylyltransferase